MKILELAIELVIGMLAVIGVYCLWRLILGRLTGNDRVVLAVEILTREEAEQAEMLIRDAMTRLFWIPSGQLIVLTTPRLACCQSFVSVLERYGVSYRVLREDTTLKEES